MRMTKGITHEQRYHLCLKKQEYPTMKQAELASWFEARYSFSISQPTISHSLRKSSEILAMGPCAVGVDSTRVRKRPVRHPDLEMAIYRWVQAQQQEQQQLWQRRQKRKLHGNGRRIKIQPGKESEGQSHEEKLSLEKLTGPAVVRQAKKIAQEMNIHDTVFCPGWLSRFKSRYNINFVEFGEISSQSQGAITIANDSVPCSVSSPGMTTPVSGPTSNSIVGMSLIEVRPSIAIPSSSYGAYASPQQETASLANLQDPDGSPVTRVASDETNFGQLVSIASTMDNLPSQQDLIQSHHSRQPSQQQQQRIMYALSNTDQYPYSHPQDHTHAHQSHEHHLSLLRPPSTSSALNISLLQSIPASVSNQAPTIQYHSPTTTPTPRSLTTSNVSASLPSDTGSQYPDDELSGIPPPPPLPPIQTPQDVQRILSQLRQYASSLLKDSSRALEHLNSLELELVSSQGHRADSIVWRPE